MWSTLSFHRLLKFQRSTPEAINCMFVRDCFMVRICLFLGLYELHILIFRWGRGDCCWQWWLHWHVGSTAAVETWYNGMRSVQSVDSMIGRDGHSWWWWKMTFTTYNHLYIGIFWGIIVVWCISASAHFLVLNIPNFCVCIGLDRSMVHS